MTVNTCQTLEDTQRDGTIVITTDITVGSFVVVELKSLADQIKLFVGVVIENNKVDNENVYLVKFLVHRNNFFVFPQLDDISDVDQNEIKCILNAPSINNRGHYKFDASLDNFYIE